MEQTVTLFTQPVLIARLKSKREKWGQGRRQRGGEGEKNTLLDLIAAQKLKRWTGSQTEAEGSRLPS